MKNNSDFYSLINHLYPTKEIKDQIDIYNNTTFYKNVRYTAVFVVLSVALIFSTFFVGGKTFYIISTILLFGLLIVFALLIYINERVRRRLDKEQLKIIVNNKMDDNLELVKNRNKFKLTSSIIIYVVLLIPLYFSIFSFIEGLLNKEYSTNPVVIFYVVLIVFLFPILIGFIIGFKFHKKKQLKIIEKIERKSKSHEL